MSALLEPMYGALSVMCLLAGLFFLRYWRLSGDRFFIWFACAFWTFAVNWALLVDTSTEHSPYIYAVRLAGFVQIIIAITLKNRGAAR